MALSRRWYAALSPEMADRIRPVHSSSRSRTRAPTIEFDRTFNLLRPEGDIHEIVIIPCQAVGNRRVCWRHEFYPQAHNIDRPGWHPPHGFQEISRPVR